MGISNSQRPQIQRLLVNNSISSSYALTATSASHASTASYFSGSISNAIYAISASHALTASYFSGSISNAIIASTASYVTSSNVWGPHGRNSILSSSYAITASYALNGGSGTIATGLNVTASFNNQSTWNFNHALNNRYVVIQTFNLSHEQIIPKNIELFDNNNAVITFPFPESGYALASLGGNTVSSSYALTASYALNGGGGGIMPSGSNATGSFTNLSQWVFNHGLNSKYVIVQAYNTSHKQLVPQNIELTDNNTVTIFFPTAESGYVVTSLGGTTNTSSYALTASYISNKSLSYIGNATITGSLILTGSFTNNIITLTTSSGTASIDCSKGNFFNLTLSSSYTLHLNASNIQPGQNINLKINQPNPSGSLQYNSLFKFSNGASLISTASSVTDIISFISFDSATLYGVINKNLL